MGGDGYALCLRAGAPLIDMEFVQFFPIGHLAPRLIGMDPIMWDPFRYKLGGRLLNKDMQEFTDATACRRTAGMSSPAMSAPTPSSRRSRPARLAPRRRLLSFQHVPAEKLREAFGPVIDRLAANGIDLTKMRSRWRRSRTITWAASPPT
jgi:succinate dehydrogenase / fumarate reductase flavoprotein subunit/fumarate reductase (CoM/CoB) subunit A